MNILLDTCEFLWHILGDHSLPPETQYEFRNPANKLFLSVVSSWEISVKYHLGKLRLPRPPELYLPSQRELHQIDPLPLEESSMKFLGALPPIHRDPFDRMLICQAQDYDMLLASSDPQIHQYPVRLL